MGLNLDVKKVHKIHDIKRGLSNTQRNAHFGLEHSALCREIQ
jgi:hypothetical protein